MEQYRRRPFGGKPTWGSFDVYPNHYGVTRYRLVIFPPGLSRDERRVLRLWRTWPAWGTLLFLVAQIWLTDLVTPGWALLISVGLWLASGAVSAALAGETRSRVRTLSALTMVGAPDPQVHRLADMRALTDLLLDADSRRDNGELTESGHEAVCWQAYDRIARIGGEPAVAP
jgi:hypothetical protein